MKRRSFPRRLLRALRLAGREIFKTPGRRASFAGADINRLVADWVTTSRTIDEEIRGDARVLRARARDLAKNNSYVKRYLRLLVSNVLGAAGIRLQALVRDGKALDRETNSLIERAWMDWASGPVTIDGKLALLPFEDVILRTLAMDGEVFIRFWRGSDVNPFGLAVQAIDADLVDERFNRQRGSSSNEVRLGVEVDKVGRPLGYHIWDRPAPSLTGTRNRYFVPAGDMVHLYRSDRVNQTRGVTWLNSIMVPAHMLDGYEESEAVASRVSSSKMGFMVKTAVEGAGSGLSIDPDGGEVKPARMQAAPGTFEVLDDGYDFKPWDPSHPTSQFGPFISQMVRKIASGLSVFSVVLANDPSGVNYSSFRSFALIERDDWRQIQEEFIASWRRPLYSEWIKLALLTGALKLATRDPARYDVVRHRPRGWSWIDPQKEAQGAILAIENQLTSRTSVLAEKGIDFEDVLAEIQADETLAALYGVTLTTTVPVETPATKEDVEAIADGNNGDGREVVVEVRDDSGATPVIVVRPS